MHLVTDPAGPINWLGDVAVPIGILLISTLFTLWLANLSRRQSRRDFDFQRDWGYAEQFLSKTHRMHAANFGNLSPDDTSEYFRTLRQEADRFLQFSSGGAWDALGGYFSTQLEIVNDYRKRATLIRRRQDALDKATEEAVLKAWKTGKLENPAPVSKTLFPEVAPLDEDDRVAVESALRLMRDMARDWPYPERRRECFVRLQEWHVDRWGWTPTDTKLAIDRLLLVSYPSESRLVQIYRTANVFVRRLRDDYRYGRLPDRFATWIRVQKSQSGFRRQQRKERRARRVERFHEIELRKLHEARNRHYMRQGMAPPPL